jgi:hypothetical protein
MLTIEHFDPRKHPLVCGLDVEENVSVVDESYNKRKTNRFVPYRVKEYNAPRFFGDTGEFLIKNEWVVCEFGGTEWWDESGYLGCSQTSRKRYYPDCSRVFFDGERWTKETKNKMSESALKPSAQPAHKKKAQSDAVTTTNKVLHECPTCGKLMNIGNLTQHIRRAKCTQKQG